MKKLLRIAALATAPFLSAYSRDHARWTADYKPLNATYSIYAGEPGDRTAPTTKERKIGLAVAGPAAKEIFESIYPDAKATCSEVEGERLRRKGEIWCIFQPRTGYRCFLGFNLRTGASLSATSC